MSDFYSVKNELNSLFNNDEENFDSCHEYCFEYFGKVMGHFYFNAYYDMRRDLPNAKQSHTHIFQTNVNITTCLDCDYWDRKESKSKKDEMEALEN